MRVVGITGRSGCGKSSVTDYFASVGYPCIDADLIAREVLLPGSACMPKLQARFGADVLDETGAVRRHLLANRAFATAEGTKALTDITLPEILNRIHARLNKACVAGAKLAFVDGAVIVGTPFEAECDELILVSAPYETSLQRICARDGIAPEMARRRLDAQMPEQTLRDAATHEICNDGSKEELLQKSEALLRCLAKEAYGD